MQTDLVTIVEGAASDEAGSVWIDAVCAELGFSHVSETGGGGKQLSFSFLTKTR